MNGSASKAPADVFERDRWFWQADYRTPVEYGLAGWIVEFGARARDLLLWTIGLTLLPILIVILIAVAPLLLYLVEAGLISPQQPDEQPAKAMNAVTIERSVADPIERTDDSIRISPRRAHAESPTHSAMRDWP